MDGAAPLGGLATPITSAVWESSARDLLVPCMGITISGIPRSASLAREG